MGGKLSGAISEFEELLRVLQRKKQQLDEAAARRRAVQEALQAQGGGGGVGGGVALDVQRTAAASRASTQQEKNEEKEERRNDWGSEQQQLDEAAARRLSVQALQEEADKVSSKEEVQRPPLGGAPRANSPHPRASSPIRRPPDVPKVLDAGVGGFTTIFSTRLALLLA